MKPLRLVTIGLSHYCEKARWALDRAGLTYTEQPHLPIVHMAATAGSRGTSVPILHTPDGVLGDSTDILRWVDGKIVDRSRRLYPADAAAAAEALALEERFDEELGPQARRWVYGHLLLHPPLVLRTFSAGLSRSERLALRVTLPLLVAALSRVFKVSERSRVRSRERCEAVFAEVSSRLADGRQWLVGDRFSAADLTFASLAAPLLLPGAYRRRLPPESELPGSLMEVVRALRDTPAGRFVLRVYESER